MTNSDREKAAALDTLEWLGLPILRFGERGRWFVFDAQGAIREGSTLVELAEKIRADR